MGKIILVASGKGGVGKSSICVSVANSLKNLGKKCILLDLDFGLRSLDILLGVEKEAVYNLADVLNEKCEPGKAIVSCDDLYRLNVICAPVNLDDPINISNMVPLCNLLIKHYDYVILDCPAGITEIFKLCLSITDIAIIITNPDPVSVRDASVASDVVYNYDIPNQYLIINKVNLTFKENIITDFDSIIDTVGIPLLGVIPCDSSVSVNSANGNLINMKNSLYTQSTMNIARRITGDNVPLLIM